MNKRLNNLYVVRREDGTEVAQFSKMKDAQRLCKPTNYIIEVYALNQPGALVVTYGYSTLIGEFMEVERCYASMRNKCSNKGVYDSGYCHKCVVAYNIPTNLDSLSTHSRTDVPPEASRTDGNYVYATYED